MEEEAVEVKEHYLYPGALFASSEPYVVTTVLGSCVSVCLYDPQLKIGGINHYMLPLWNGEGLASPKYGNIAISKLVEKMEIVGADRRRLKAKIFGGGDVLKITHGTMNVGERNVAFALNAIKELGIPIIAQDVRGTTGRKLHFNTHTGSVLMKRLSKQIDDITD